MIIIKKINAEAIVFQYKREIILDYFFVTKNALEVDSYEVLTDQIDGDYPSDHNAIVMKYRLK